MSLIHWWPLNGDYIDRVTGVAGTDNSNDTMDGKLGGTAINCTGNSWLETNQQVILGTGDFSIAAWVYLVQTSGKTYQAIISNKPASGSSNGFSIYWNQTQKKFLWSTADGTAGEYWMASTIDNFMYNTWNHVVMVRNNSDDKKGYFYINGIRYELASTPAIRNITQTATVKIGKNNTNSATYYWTGGIQDVRIYDHALSVKEVQELSKGLMLHYTFNDIGSENTTNLVTGVTKGGQTTVDANQVVTTSGADLDTYFYLKLSKALEAGKTYTLSCVGENIQMNSDGHGKYFRFGLQGQGGVPQISIYNGPSSLTFTATSKQAVSSLLLDDITGHRSLNNSKFYNFQMEEKDHATSYVKGSRNNPYYDESGYNHDGIQNQIDYISDSNNGSCCASFNGTHSYIEVPNWKPSLPNEPYTIAFWVNPAEDKTRDIYFGNHPTTNGTFNIERNASNYLRVYYNSDTPIGPISSITIPNSVWTHIVMTFDGTTFKAYKDGVEKYSKALSQTLSCTNTNWKIGSDYRTAVGTSEATRYKGLMSDFRIYASALTPAQVLELYESKAAIDKNQNIFTNEIIEQQNTNLVNADSWEQGGITDASGTNADNMMNRLRTKYIPVMPNTKYYFKAATGYNVRCVHRYRSDMTWINTGGSTANSTEITTPSDCYYVRWVIQSTNASSEVPVANIATYQPVMVIKDFADNYGFDTNTDVEVTNKYILKTKDIIEGHEVGFFKDGTTSGNNFNEI